MSQLIDQNSDKKYYLTELGKHAYNSLKDNIKTIIAPEFTDKEFESPILKGLMKITPKNIIAYQEKKEKLVLTISIAILSIGSILCGIDKLFPFLFFFSDTILSTGIPEPFNQIYFSFLYLTNFLLYFMIIEGVCRVFYKSRENTLRLLNSFGIIFFPMVGYLLIHFILDLIGLLNVIRVIDNILLILFQLWSLWLLTYNLSANKLLKIENSLIISLLIHYGGFSLFLLLSI